MRYAEINEEGIVVNVILWDGVSELEGSENLTLLEEDGPAGPDWVLDGEEWVAPPSNEPEIAQPSVDELRQAAYTAEADPVFFKWQRGEATQQDWLDVIADIKARYPDA